MSVDTTRKADRLHEPNPSTHVDSRMNWTLRDMLAFTRERQSHVVRYCGEIGSPEKIDGN